MTGREIDYLVRELNGQLQNNQMLTMYDGKMGKIKRENYFPDENGVVCFDNLSTWSDVGWSVYEMTEFINKYRDRITDLRFRAYDGSIQPFMNVYESEAYSNNGEYSSVVVLGESDSHIDLVGKVSGNSWFTDSLFPELKR